MSRQIVDDPLPEALAGVVGEGQVLTGRDCARWSSDWRGKLHYTPRAVVRPATTAEVAAVLHTVTRHGAAIVPVAGNTGLSGGAMADGAVMLSLDRMRRIIEIRADARIAVVEAGVILSQLHDAVAGCGLNFPMTFGARGSAMIGGLLATNAGGSNVLRYGNMRQLCLGLEVVLASGKVMNLMSALHKDNTGYALKDLMIGSEGTLGVITKATLRLVPRPQAFATAMVATASLDGALTLLNRLQAETGGAVEAFEYMPRAYIKRHLAHFSGARPPFPQGHDTNIMVEVGAVSRRDADAGDDGTIPVAARLESVLSSMLERGEVLDAVIARSEAERAEMWDRREAAAEITFDGNPVVNCDISVPLDAIGTFLERMATRLPGIDPDAHDLAIAHLGDGNIHYCAYPSRDDRVLMARIAQVVEDEACALGGSFSAEHGVGIAKLDSMARHKDQVALDMMHAIKTAFDPMGILNPGKVLPPR